MKHLAWLSLAWLSQLLLFSGGAMAEERTISFKPGTEHVVLWRDFETMDACYTEIKEMSRPGIACRGAMVAVLTGDATLKLLTMEHYKDDKRYTLFTHVEALSGIFAGKKGYVESATIQND